MNIDWAMHQDLIYKELTGHGGFGNPTYAPDMHLKGRVQFKQKLVRTANGSEEMSNVEIWAPLSITPKADDRIGFEGKLYRVLDAGRPVSLYGETSHWKVFGASVAS